MSPKTPALEMLPSLQRLTLLPSLPAEVARQQSPPFLRRHPTILLLPTSTVRLSNPIASTASTPKSDNLKLIKLKTGRIYRIRLSNGCEYIGKTVKTLEERLAEHRASPTNEQMKATLDEFATIELIQQFKYKDERQLLSAEEFYIAQALERGARLLNDKHNSRKEVKKTEKREREAAPAKININEDTTKLRFRIRIQSQKISKEDQVRYFPWREDKAAALKEAEAWREHLIHKYL